MSPVIGLLAVSVACIFLIFLDYNRAKNVRKAILFSVALIVTMILVFLATRFLQFKIIYLLMAVPFLLILVLYLKNLKSRDPDKKKSIQDDLLDN